MVVCRSIVMGVVFMIYGVVSTSVTNAAQELRAQ